MHYFQYKNGELHAEEIPLRRLGEKYGTPLYIYSYKTLKRHVNAYREAFKDIKHILCYAVKANSNIHILRLIKKMGGGADIVSGGELFRALKAGINPKRIVYAGVGKNDNEIRFALKSGILMFNVESPSELERIDMIAKRMNLKAPIALRINPHVDAKTHPYISTGLKKHKFGIPIEDAIENYLFASRLKNIKIMGIHKHIGSQILEISPFIDALKSVLALVDELKERNIKIRYLDIGGGLGISYRAEEDSLYPHELSKAIKPYLKNRDLTIIIEPGRSIVGNAGVLLTKVLYTKDSLKKRFIIVDAGMNDLIRPTLYDAHHEIISVKKMDTGMTLSDVVGPICESGDFLAKGRKMPDVAQGDYLCVMSAGAYGFSMSSNYNSRPRPAEVMVNGKRDYLIRKRESYDDLIRGELI